MSNDNTTKTTAVPPANPSTATRPLAFVIATSLSNLHPNDAETFAATPGDSAGRNLIERLQMLDMQRALLAQEGRAEGE